MNRDITVSSIETGPYCVNTYFVRLNNSDECVIIDPADAGKVNTYLEKNGLGCNAILLTHCHFDHKLGVPELQKQGMKVYIGELDEAGLRDKDINLTFRKIEPFYADVKLKDGDTVREAGLEFNVLFTPGHTVGGVSYVLEEKKCVFVGDTLFRRSIGRTDFSYGSYEDIISSIKNKLFALEGNYIAYPGHGPATTLDEERAANPYVR